jgi:hypothetical protein
MTWRERLVRSLPYVIIILTAAGVVITDELWLAIGTLVAMWLLPSPVNVSRETSTEPDVSRETSSESKETAPCHVLHGAAEPHVLGCEGWSYHFD